jgi:2-keto-4-pentenoate hydratase/2-oxohepta-3-ene-1,7-dioic acid hydratase in catechol pathway
MVGMLLVRFGPEGFLAAGPSWDELRLLLSDPLETRPGGWKMGRKVSLETEAIRAPWLPGKIVGVGRSFAEHAKELGNPVPEEPLLFLKAPSSVIGPRAPIVLPPESKQVHYEGEIGVLLRERLRRATPQEAAEAILGFCPANDVTARDLQQRDRTFVRAKCFDTFCPLGPAILVDADWEGLEVVTRLNGVERQRGCLAALIWPLPELLSFISRVMTLEPGDLVLTGTPAGVGEVQDGDWVEVEVPGCGVLRNPVEAWREA